MNDKKFIIVYFSPTGNVFHLAENLAENMGADNCEIIALERQ